MLQSKAPPNSYRPTQQTSIIENFCYSNGQLSLRLIALFSLPLSLWIILFDPVINSDGVLYLFTAETYLQSGFSAALSEYPWPFFSVLIATIQQITHVSLLISSQILVSLCYLLMSYAFVRTVSELGGTKSAQFFALLIISFHPLMADYRSSTMRDPGMWAFMLLALRELLRYAKRPRLRYQLKWIVFIGLAFLFRIETLIIAIASPLSLAFLNRDKFSSGPKKMLRFVSLPALLFTLATAAFLMLSSEPIENFKLLKDFQHYSLQLSNLMNVISVKSDMVSEALLTHTAKEDAFYAVISVFITISALNIIRAVIPVYLLILFINQFDSSRIVLNRNARIILNSHLLILGVYLFLFTLSRQFNLERYSFQFVIILLLYVPFIFDNLWHTRASNLKTKIPIAAVLIVLFLDTVINSDYKKAYINDAAQWLQTTVDKDREIISNHHHIAYFNGKTTHKSEDLYLKKETEERPWAPGILYAYHAKNQEEPALRKRINMNKGHIFKEFRGQKKGIVILFELPSQIK
ncbi:MAG: hypothetical protein ACI92E_001526 [Oceanicoccus sp.]|jgi:hypothetical protein